MIPTCASERLWLEMLEHAYLNSHWIRLQSLTLKITVPETCEDIKLYGKKN